MAETTPLASNNAFRGTQAYHHFSFQQNHIRRTPPKNPPPGSRGSNSQRFSFQHPNPEHLQPQTHTQHIQIPIRFVITGSVADPTSASVLQQNTVPVFTKVGVVLSSRPEEPSSPRPVHVKNSHPPLKRLSTAYRPPRPSVSTPPPVQRFVHFNQPLPEQPPPYEQIFDVRVEEESAEPLECPFVLVGGSPRKEKKRSLRSRLLRHLTGKKAAAQQARGSSTMTSGSHKAKDPSRSPMVGPRNSQLIAHLQMPPATLDNNVHVVHSGASHRISQQISNDGRYLDINGQPAFQLPTAITQNGLVIDRSQLYGTPGMSNLQTTNQVLILHTVPEEDPIQETSSISTVATSSRTTVTITTSEPSTPNVHSVPTLSVHSVPTSSVHSVPTLNVHSVPTSSVHSDPSSSVHDLPTSSVDNISSPGASHATRLPSPTPSSVFIHDHAPSDQHTPEPRTRAFKSSISSEWSQVKVPRTRVVHSSLSPHKNSPVISGKSDRSRDSSVHSQAEATKDRPVTPGSMPERPHRKDHHQSRKKNVAPETLVEIDENSHTKSYTINLKPGMYKLNLNFPGKKRGSPSQTININVPNSDGKASSSPQVVGKQPPVPEPLYYENSKVSLPQRFVHLLKPSSLSSRNQHSRKSPKVTIIQPSVDNTGPKVITVLSHGEKHQQVIQHEASSSHKRGGGGGCTARSQKKERYRLAERKKVEGNEAYRNKEYREALQHYTQAIELCPDSAAYYSNRSACFMMLAKYRDALNDAQRAVTLDKNFVKGWLRVGKCHIALGDGGAALSVLRQAQELEPNNTALLQEMSSALALQKCIEECAKAVEKKDYRTAVFHIDQALRYALGGLELRINKAEYLTYLGRLPEAEDIVNDILIGDNKNADAIYVRGLCRYYQDNQDAAFQHFQNVLRFVPDHSKAKDTYKRAKLLIQKKEQGNSAFKMGDFACAMAIYSEALEIDDRNKSTNAKLYCNRAIVAAKLGKLEQSIADCTLAISLDDAYIKAYLRRANTYQQTEQYEEAVRDLEKVYRLQRSQEHKRMLQEAKVQLKRSKRKDYYKILGVSKTASDDEIKKAYRKMALLHHPDRHSSASAIEKAEHEKKFKELGEAYAVLTDPKKRSMHDRGQDVNDPDCGFSRDANFDPNQVFEAFFGPDFFQSQSSHHHYYDQGQQHQQHQQQFPGQFQGQHPGFQGFPGMPGGFQFEF